MFLKDIFDSWLMRNIGVWCYVVQCFCIAPEIFRSITVVLFPLAPQMTWPSHFGSNPTAWTIIRDVYCWCASNKSKRKYHSKPKTKQEWRLQFLSNQGCLTPFSRGLANSHDDLWRWIKVRDVLSKHTGSRPCLLKHDNHLMFLATSRGRALAAKLGHWCLMSIWHVRLLHPGELHSKNSAAQALWFHTPYHPCMVYLPTFYGKCR